MAILRIDEVLAKCDTLRRRFDQCALADEDRKDIMENWERLIEADNREGVLAGTDKDGHIAPALKYRPITPGGQKLTVAQRLGQHPNKLRGEYMGKGPAASGLNNNLTTAEYRLLDGPRLAPRRQFSRVITNLATANGVDPLNHSRWFATGAWIDVVSAQGEPFLKYHFTGDGQQLYDLRGVRPAGLKKMRVSAYEWAKDVVRRLWGSNYG